jgi:Protein of unknown function (DUF1572)
MSESLGAHYLQEARSLFGKYKAMAERAMIQLDDRQFFAVPDPETNSVALTVKHIAGNLRSRWTDFLTTDGEKPDRHRDREVEIAPEDTRAALLERWEAGWALLFGTLETLTPEDLQKVVPIRAEPHTVVQALQRSLTHYAYHTGQIVQLAKHWKEGDWQTLSVPRGKTEKFNLEMLARREMLARAGKA